MNTCFLGNWALKNRGLYRSVDLLDLSQLYDFNEHFRQEPCREPDENYGSIWYMTLPGLRPAAAAPQEDRPGPSCAREPFHLIEINGLNSSTKSWSSPLSLMPGLKPFSEISPWGLPQWRGRSPQERHEKIIFQQSRLYLFFGHATCIRIPGNKFRQKSEPQPL